MKKGLLVNAHIYIYILKLCTSKDQNGFLMYQAKREITTIILNV